MADRRVVVVSDLHCGHIAGLTPPQFQEGTREPEDKWDEVTRLHNKADTVVKETWEHYTRLAAELQPIDVLLVAGDCVDGTGDKTGGAELLEADPEVQQSMAAACLKVMRAKKIVIVYGTAYHVGHKGYDYENGVARRVKAEKIGAHDWPEINGLVFDLKHKIGRSSIPHGRATPMKRAALWNALWADEDLQPRARVVLRGHVHYFDYEGNSTHLGIILPALQAMGTRYGARECEGIVNWGLLHFDVDTKGNITDWVAHLPKIKGQKALPTKLF